MNSDLKELYGRDPHAVLGVEQGASKQEVTKAFHRIAARGGHPDTGGDERTFRQLTSARDILLDSRRLADYTAARDENNNSWSQSSATTHTSSGSAPTYSRPSNTTRTVHMQPHRSPARSANLHPLLVIAVVLALAGPLLWPLAAITALVGLWRMGRSA